MDCELPAPDTPHGHERAYQLKDIKDFDGNDTAFSAGATAAGGVA